VLAQSVEPERSDQGAEEFQLVLQLDPSKCSFRYDAQSVLVLATASWRQT